MKNNHSNSRVGTTMVVLLLFLIGVWFTDQERSAVSDAKPVAVLDAERAASPVLAALPPWSEVQPANHGTNPIPDGFVQTAVYEDVARLAFPTPAPVGVGLRARVLLGEISGATGRHKFVRIEEVASVKENRLLDRRVMPADHLVVYAQMGKTEVDVRAGLPQGYVIRKKLLGDRRYLIGFESKDADSLEMAANVLKDNAVLTSAVPDGYVFSSSIPNDPLFNQQWGLHNTGQTVNGVAGTVDADIDAPEAWDLTTGSSSVTVAVIDSGIDLTHEDLVDNIWTNPGESGGGKETNGIDDDGNGLIDDVHGWDFVNDDNVPQDDFGHGTHVAGIIGAKGNNGVGVAGVCWNVGLVPLKALRINGSGLWSDVTEAVEYAKQKNLGIVNFSLGAYGGAPLGVQTLLEEADTLLFCAAAGNGAIGTGGARVGDNLDQVAFSPATLLLGNVISVGAIGSNGQFVTFSNYGRVGVDIGAPGAAILSTKAGGGYEVKSGTSMATAFVSGAAAVCQIRKRRGALETRGMLQACPDRVPRQDTRCAVAGRIWLDKVAVQSTQNIRWRHLGTAGASRHRHIVPDGRLFNVSGTTPLQNEIATMFSETGFLLSTDMSLSGNRNDFTGANSVLSVAFQPGNSKILNGDNVTSLAGTHFENYGYEKIAYLMLKRDGSVWSFGTNNSWTGRATPPKADLATPAQVPGLSGIVQIGSDRLGWNHLALRSDGTLFGFGANTGTQVLGFGHTNAVPFPEVISGLPPLKEFFIVGDNVFCVATNGEIWGWGSNGYALGILSGVAVGVPIRLPAWDGCFSFGVSASDSNGVATLGAQSDGRVYVSSSDGGAALGGIPRLVAGLENFESAPTNSLGMDRRGRVWEWGRNKLSRSLNELYNASPSQVPTSAPAFDLLKPSLASMAVTMLSDGRAQTWGRNDDGSLGNGIGTRHLVPVEVPELSEMAWLDATHFQYHLLFGKAGGRVKSLGAVNPFNLSITQEYELPSLDGIIETASFDPGRIAALRSDGSLWSYSRTAHFQYSPPIPQQWKAMQGFANIRLFIGDGFHMVIGVDDQNNFWAQNGYLSFPPPAVNVTGVLPPDFSTVVGGESGGDGVVVVCSDGKIWTFGTLHNLVGNPVGVTLATKGLRLLADMGPGAKLTWPLALKADGTVWTVFTDGSAPLEITALNPAGAMLVPIIKLAKSALGPAYAALRTDGTIWSWGRAEYSGRGSVSGMLPPAKLETIADTSNVYSGRTAIFAKRANGSVWAWGANQYGVLGSRAYAATPVETLNYNISTEVQNSGLGLNDWLYTHFSRAEIGAINISGDEADPDRDGLTNLVEYALGSDPKVPSDRDGIDVGLTCSFEAVGSEALSAAESDGAVEHHFTVTLSRRAKRPGIIYRVEISDDLVNWTASASRLQLVREETPIQAIYRDMEPLSVTQRRWARLVIRKGN